MLTPLWGGLGLFDAPRLLPHTSVVTCPDGWAGQLERISPRPPSLPDRPGRHGLDRLNDSGPDFTEKRRLMLHLYITDLCNAEAVVSRNDAALRFFQVLCYVGVTVDTLAPVAMLLDGRVVVGSA